MIILFNSDNLLLFIRGALFNNDNGWNKSYYNQGWGAYGGLGLAVNVNENIAIDISYDILGISSDVSFDNMTSLLGAGLRMKF